MVLFFWWYLLIGLFLDSFLNSHFIYSVLITYAEPRLLKTLFSVYHTHLPLPWIVKRGWIIASKRFVMWLSVSEVYFAFVCRIVFWRYLFISKISTVGLNVLCVNTFTWLLSLRDTKYNSNQIWPFETFLDKTWEVLLRIEFCLFGTT